MVKQEAIENNSGDIVVTDDRFANDDVAGSGRPGPTPLVQRVYQGLLAQISAGDYEPEQRLPGEHELAEQFLVSRPVVRDALSRLRDEGLIYSRRGAGSFVKARPEESRPLVGYAAMETNFGAPPFTQSATSVNIRSLSNHTGSRLWRGTTLDRVRN